MRPIHGTVILPCMDRAELIERVKQLASKADAAGEREARAILGSLVAALMTGTEADLMKLTFQHSMSILDKTMLVASRLSRANK